MKKYYSLLFVFLGLFMVIWQLSKDNVKSPKDLTEIKGTLKSYSFVESRGIRSHTFSYYIYLDNYNNSFQIPVDFVECLFQEYFERDAKIGDLISLKISKESAKKLHSGKKLEIFSIRYKGSEYLVENLTIQKHNSKFPFYGGILCILVGSVLFIRAKKEKEKLPPTNAIANAGMRVS